MLFGDSCSGLSILCGYLAGRTRWKRNLRQPEVENLSVPALGDKDVGGLDIPVDYAFGVSSIQSVRNLNGLSSHFSPGAAPQVGQGTASIGFGLSSFFMARRDNAPKPMHKNGQS